MRKTPLRTDETHERYENIPKEEKCFMCNAVPLQDFIYWKIIVNAFPYDAITETHHMLVPKEHVPSVTKENVRKEYDDIIRTLSQYDSVLFNNPHAKTHPDHEHYHLLKWKTI